MFLYKRCYVDKRRIQEGIVGLLNCLKQLELITNVTLLIRFASDFALSLTDI